ncbi:MAG: CHAT domain-containing protein, partial [Acidobacteria bacterium]|nr:CHAT domain-containing protein [Acidobacteriota bacterium]
IQDDYLYIFYIAKDRSMLWRKSNIKDINNKVRELYKYLQKPDPAEREKLDNAAAYLYNQLIYPIAKKADLKKNLIVIPDEILFYLPFDVLKDNKGKYMVESYNITYTPSATSMKLISKQELKRDLSLLAVANPAHEFLPEKEKTSEKTDTRDFDFNLVNQPLPNAEKEVSGISSFFDKNKKMTLVGKEAKEETIKSIDLKKFRFLHFATHGILDEEKPLRSGLLLAIDRDPKEDGILQYREIYDLKTNADLVVLSACKTGLGKIIKGDGLIGMSRGFLVSGSKSVIVSLWNVADYSTAILMQEFYRGLVRDGFTKAEALRKSKIALMKFTGETSSERGITGISGSRQSVKKKVDFSHPYFWASFIIMGSPGK